MNILGSIRKAINGKGQILSETEREPARDAEVRAIAPLVTSSPIGPGTVLKDRYLLGSELSRGGMGVVYRAHDQVVHGRPVVVKFLLAQTADAAWITKKFHHESEALSRIDDPGVVKVLDRGVTSDGAEYLVMEFVQGTTLRDYQRRGLLEYPLLVRVVRQIGRALNAAHGCGVLHRDLKPDNVMIYGTGDGLRAKLIDFGIAKLDNPQSTAGTHGPITAGTLLYMAPEQLEQGYVSPASDIYSFGVLVYEMAAGHLPFVPRETTTLGAMRELVALQKDGRVRRIGDSRPGFPAEAETVLLGALAFEPTARYQDADAFAAAVQKAFTGIEPSRAIIPAETRTYSPGAETIVPGSGSHTEEKASHTSLVRRRIDVGVLTVIVLDGFLDAHTSNELRDELEELIDSGRSRIIFNCLGLTYLSSAGVGALMANLAVARERGGDIKLCELSPGVLHVLKLLGFHELLDLTEHEEDAILLFSRPYKNQERS